MIHIGFTGTQIGMSERQKRMLESILLEWMDGDEQLVLHHGDCLGADLQAHAIAIELGMRVYIHPPIIGTKRAYCEGYKVFPPKPYLERNQDIVDASDFLIAAPKSHEEELRSGTWATIRRARKKGIPVEILYRGEVR